MFTKNIQVGAVSGGLVGVGIISATMFHAAIVSSYWIDSPVVMLAVLIICIISFSSAGAQWRVYRND